MLNALGGIQGMLLRPVELMTELCKVDTHLPPQL